MKFGTMSAVALSLGVAGAGIVANVPAFAKEKAAAAAPSFNLSKPVRDAIAAAQKALAAGDNATTQAQVDVALAAAKTDDDRFVASSILYDLSKKTQDKVQQNKALEGMLVGDRLPVDQKVIILLSLGQTALQANDLPKADRLLTQAVQLAPNNNDGYALLAETKMKQQKPAEALAIFQQAMDKAAAAGTKLPADFYGRAINISYTAKLAAQNEALTQAWVAAYPTKDNWRDTLIMWRDLHKPDADLTLDLMRFQSAIGAMKGQADFLEYSDATYLRYPAEAKAAIDAAVRAGAVNLAANQSAREISTLVNGKVAADKASLGASAATVKGPKGTARLALSTADSYASHGDYAAAIPLYKAAIEKGGLDANLVNTRLGVALARSGDKAGAKAVFATITGPRAALAKYWTIWLDGAQAA